MEAAVESAHVPNKLPQAIKRAYFLRPTHVSLIVSFSQLVDVINGLSGARYWFISRVV